MAVHGGATHQEDTRAALPRAAIIGCPVQADLRPRIGNPPPEGERGIEQLRPLEARLLQ